MGLVEQPQLGAPGDEAGERGAPALTRRQRADGHVARAARRPRAACIAAATSSSVAPTVAPQNRTFSATVRSRYSPLWCPSRPTRRPHRVALGGQVVPEHVRRAAGDRQQAGAQPQQRGLAGAVRALRAARSRRASTSRWRRRARGSARAPPPPRRRATTGCVGSASVVMAFGTQRYGRSLPPLLRFRRVAFRVTRPDRRRAR